MTNEMPFGKFKGTCIEDLPDWYLDWLVDELDPDAGWVYHAAVEEQDLRLKQATLEELHDLD